MNVNLIRKCTSCLLFTKSSFQWTGHNTVTLDYRVVVFRRLLYCDTVKRKPLVFPYCSTWMKNISSMLPCITPIRLASKKGMQIDCYIPLIVKSAVLS